MWLVFIIGGLFIVKLYQLQILQHAYYEAEGLKEHQAKFVIPAKRGLIYARDGSSVVPLVLNEPNYLVFADPRYIKNPEATVEVLRRIAGGNIVKDVTAQLADKQRQYVVLAKQLNKQQADLIKKANLAGVGLQASDRRVYPEGPLAAQVLGYVNGDGAGQYGIEQSLNGLLNGHQGLLKASATDVNGIPIESNSKDIQVPAEDGANLVLTIDRSIQGYAEQALKTGLEKAKAKHGSVLVMDPQTGAVLAMANLPSYDPAKFYDLGENDYSVYQNPIVSDPYEPGSVIKTLTMAAGLDAGVIKPDSTFNNTGSIKVDDYTIKNVLQSEANGQRTMTEVLQFSLNTGVVHVLEELGGGQINNQAKAKLYDYFASRYMLSQKTGIEQSGEVASKIFAPDDEQGNAIRYANMSFGQGMNVSMIQVASAFSAIVNGGTYYKPHLVYGDLKDSVNVRPQPPQVVKAGIVKPEASSQLKDMIRIARQKTFPNADRPGYIVGGKTGTAQIIDPKTGKYIDSNAIGTYLGFGGDNTPRYVIMVRVVDSQIGGYAGSAAAAPIFLDISNWLLDYLKLQPVQ
jgi:cell division protein FtsI/penicillin-binding protein 2